MSGYRSSPSPPPVPPKASPPWALRSSFADDDRDDRDGRDGRDGHDSQDDNDNNSLRLSDAPRFSSDRVSSFRSSGGSQRAARLQAQRRRQRRRSSLGSGSGGYGFGYGYGSGSGSGGLRGAAATAQRRALAWAEHGRALFLRLTAVQRAAVVALGVVGAVLVVLGLVYNHRIYAALGPVARGWHDLPGGWVLVWLLVFVTGFPPVIGYSTACTLAGLVYGFPWGWPIAASANVAGSLAAFVASRGVLSGYVDRLVGGDARFVALGHVLRHDGLWVLAAVRFCPLPYSLSNGFLATIPSITPRSFALSTALASPKLLVHVFIGSRLALLAEDGGSMSAGAKALNYASMLAFSAVGLGVGLFIYRRTMARAAEIARAEGGGGIDDDDDDDDAAAREEGRARGPGGSGFSDSDDVAAAAGDDDGSAPLMDPDDADVAALMDDDDISLWAAEADQGAAAYRDDSDGEAGPPAGKR